MAANVWSPGSGTITANAENGSLLQKFSSTAGQVLFPLTAFSYVVNTGSIRVYRNGVKLQQSEVDETSSMSFTLVGIVLAVGEIIEASAVLGSQDAVTAAAISAAASAAEAAATVANTVKKTSDTGSAALPIGTTAERDGAEGSIRGNSETKKFEGYINGRYQDIGGGQMLGQAEVKGISFNAQVIAEDISIPANTNAYAVGPIDLSNCEITFGDNSTWTIL